MQKEINVIEGTLDSDSYEQFKEDWAYLYMRQFFDIFKKRFGANNFERRTKKAKEEGTLTEIIVKYCFDEVTVKARFHLDIGMKSYATLSSLGVFYTTTSYATHDDGEERIASFAHAHSVGDLGLYPPRRDNYTALMRSKCEEFSEQYKVPVKMTLIKDPPREKCL